MAMQKDPTAFRERFKAYKDGKSVKEIYDAGLPRYAEGKTVIGSNVDMKDDGTFTDDYTRAFDDLIVTPQGPRVKTGQLYKYQEPWDDEKFINAITVGGLNNLSPAQWARRGYDLINGNLTAESWLNGNAGIVPDSYAKQNPGMAMAANALFDFWTLGGPSLLKSATNIRRLNPVQYTKYEPQIQPVQQTQVLLKPVTPLPYQIENIPGYLLRSLMRGNPLEKQLSKSGTISVNSIQAQANKASEVEKAVINKVLQQQEFSGQKAIDYNKFRKAIHDELIEYDVVPNAEYEEYGINRLGFNNPTMDDRNNMLWQKAFDEAKQLHPDWNEQQLTEFINSVIGEKRNPLRLRTFTFESPRIGVGDDTHYNINTLGHSRTYMTDDEPGVLHVMESLSDWGQHKIREPKFRYSLDENGNSNLAYDDSGNIMFVQPGTGIHWHELRLGDQAQAIQDAKQLFFSNYPTELAKYLHDNYTFRLILENLKYAAEHGQSKMRYPTANTAAKIEGYQKGFTRSEETDAIQKQMQDVRNEIEELMRKDRDPFDDKNPINIRIEELLKKEKELRGQFDDALTRTPLDYSSEHKTILKKYSDFEKQFKKLHKGAEVRTVTDKKGNTWYEVDVPKDYLNSEWQYGFAPWLIGGGTAATLGLIPEYANGKSPIHIKPANRGKFTALKKRTGHSASWFKKNGTPALKKMATFALNARKWSH